MLDDFYPEDTAEYKRKLLAHTMHSHPNDPDYVPHPDSVFGPGEDEEESDSIMTREGDEDEDLETVS